MSHALLSNAEIQSLGQAVRLEAKTDTMEDYLETQIPPLPQDVAGRFVVVQDFSRKHAAPELLTVSDDGKPIHFAPDENSQSGWAQSRIPMPGQSAPVTALRGFYRDGLLYAFIHYAAAKRWRAKDSNPRRGPISRVVPMVRDRQGQWSRMPLSNNLRNVLTSVRQLDIHLDGNGKPYLYGLSLHYSPETFFVVTQDAKGEWQVVYLEEAEDFSAYRLVAGFGDEELSVLRVGGPNLYYRGGTVREERGRRRLVFSPEDWKYVDLRHGNLALNQLIPFPKRGNGLDFLVLSGQKHLDHVTLRPGRTPSVLLLTGRSDAPRSGLASVSLSVDSDGLYSVFALSQEEARLWILRQRIVAKKNTIDYHPWSEIGDTYSALAAPVSLARGPEFFAVDLNRHLLHAHQPAESETDVWQRTFIERPKASGDPLRCTTHNLELTALGDAGQPVPNAVVHISADRVAMVYVNGLSYRVGPKPLAPVPLESNAAGRLSLRVVCRRESSAAEGKSLGLSAPVISARLTPRGGQPFERSYAPDLTFYKRLANLDGDHPMTPARLKEKGLLPPDMDPGQANLVAASTQQVAKNMVLRFAHQDPQLAAFAAAPFAEGTWEFDFKSGGVRVRELTQRQWQSVSAEAPKGLGRALGDLFRWIANTAQAIAKVVFKVTARVIEFVIETAKGIQRFVLDAAAQAAEFLTGLFKALAELVGKIKDAAAALIHLLEALLNFDDIIITKDVLKVGFESFMGSLENSLARGVPEYITQQFQGARSQLRKSFAAARDGLDGKTLNQIAGESGGGHQPGNDRYSQAVSGQAVRGGFVGQHAINALGSPAKSFRMPKLSAKEQKDLDEVLAELTKAYEDYGLEERAKTLRDELKGVFEQPENLLTGSLKVLLTLLEGVLELALTVANTLINLILRLLGKALGLLRRLFNQAISIPVVSALYKQVVGSDLTILDLSLLILAAPGTILFKVVTKLMRPQDPVKRPFERSQIGTIQKMFAQFGDIRRMIEGPPKTEKTTPRERKAMKNLLLAFGLVSGCATFFYNYFEIGTDALAGGQVPVAELGAVACIAGLVMTFLSTPIASLNKRQEERSTAEHYGLVLWVAKLAPLALNTLIASATKGAKALKGIPIVGPILTALIGAIAAAAAAVAIVLQAGEENIAGVLSAIRAFCAGCSDMARFFIALIKVKPPWNLIAAAILVGVVYLSGWAQTGLAVAAAIAAFAATDTPKIEVPAT